MSIPIHGSLPHDHQNNLIPSSDLTYGITTEALLETDTAFSFTIHGGNAIYTEGDVGLDIPNAIEVIVGLMQWEGTDLPIVTSDDCILWVKWDRGDGYSGLPGTVRETWGNFTTTSSPASATRHGRSNVDVGYSRPGPRYTLGLEGANFVGYVDYHKQGGAVPRCIVSAPAGGFPFPLRLVMSIASPGSGTTPAQVLDIMLEGKLGEKATLTADNKTEWGVDPDHLHLRIYQLGVVPGFPVDIDL